MPYIKQEDRDNCHNALKQFGFDMAADCVGELNYCISKLIHTFLLTYDVNYANINAVIGVLECAKMELYRQLAAPYEDEKKSQNGPVSSLDGAN